MPDESTTPDLLERWRGSFTALNGGDVDGALSLWGSDPVWDITPMDLRMYQGLSAIRGIWEDWIGAYEGRQRRPMKWAEVSAYF